MVCFSPNPAFKTPTIGTTADHLEACGASRSLFAPNLDLTGRQLQGKTSLTAASSQGNNRDLPLSPSSLLRDYWHGDAKLLQQHDEQLADNAAWGGAKAGIADSKHVENNPYAGISQDLDMMACNCRALQPQVTRLSPDINTNDSYASVETHDSHSQSSRFIPDAIKALRLSFAGHDLPSSSNSSLSPQNASAFWQQGKAQNGSTPVGIGQMPDAHEHIQDQQRYQQAAPQPQAGFNPRTLANSPADAIEAMCDIRDAVELDHSVLSGLKRKQETRLDVCSAHLSRAGPYSNPPSKMQKMPGTTEDAAKQHMRLSPQSDLTCAEQMLPDSLSQELCSPPIALPRSPAKYNTFTSKDALAEAMFDLAHTDLPVPLWHTFANQKHPAAANMHHQMMLDAPSDQYWQRQASQRLCQSQQQCPQANQMLCYSQQQQTSNDGQSLPMFDGNPSMLAQAFYDFEDNAQVWGLLDQATTAVKPVASPTLSHTQMLHSATNSAYELPYAQTSYSLEQSTQLQPHAQNHDSTRQQHDSSMPQFFPELAMAMSHVPPCSSGAQPPFDPLFSDPLSVPSSPPSAPIAIPSLARTSASQPLSIRTATGVGSQRQALTAQQASLRPPGPTAAYETVNALHGRRKIAQPVQADKFAKAAQHDFGSLRGDSFKSGDLKASSLTSDSLKSDSLRSYNVQSDSLTSDSFRSGSLQSYNVQSDSLTSNSLSAPSTAAPTGSHPLMTCKTGKRRSTQLQRSSSSSYSDRVSEEECFSQGKPHKHTKIAAADSKGACKPPKSKPAKQARIKRGSARPAADSNLKTASTVLRGSQGKASGSKEAQRGAANSNLSAGRAGCFAKLQPFDGFKGTIGDSQFASINSKLQASAAAFLVVPHFQLDPFSTGSVKVYTTSHVQNPQPSFDAAVKTQSSRSRASAGLGDAHGSGTPGLARQLHRRVAGQHGLETDGNGVCCNVPPVSSNDVSCSVPQVSKSRSLQLSGTIKIGTQQ